jgi:hypothetical protein
MSGSTADDDDPFAEGWASLVRYPAMLAGTMAGQLVGIAIDAAVGTRSFWIPLMCSVALEAVVGARFGGQGASRLVDPSQCTRVSITYSLAFLALSVPLAFWVGASHVDTVSGGVGLSFFTPGHIALALVALAAATAARAGLMIALVRAARGRG